MATGTKRPDDFEVPMDIRNGADIDTKKGLRILVSPAELCDLMFNLDRALSSRTGCRPS